KWEVKADGSYTFTSADTNPAIAGEAEDYWRKRLPKIPELVADVSVKTRYEWQKQGNPGRRLAATYGAKGTNFAILDMALRKKSFDRSSFDHGFLIPFSFYYQHTQSPLTGDFCGKAQKKCQEDSGLASDIPAHTCMQSASNRGTLSAFI